MGRSGLARGILLVLLTLGAAIPAAAEAAPAFKTPGPYPATIHGSATKGSEVINTEGGKVDCAAAYHAELEGPSATLALAPAYTGCEAFGFIEATVNHEGCKYILHVTEQVAEDKYKSTFDISCEAGKAVKVQAGTCKVEIKAQSGLASVALANDTEAAPKRDLTFDPEVANLAYTVTQDGFFCPFGGTGAKTGGTFTGSATTLTGQSPSSPETKIGVEVGEPPAGPPAFKAGLYPATIHGSAAKGAQLINTEGGKVECATAYHAVLEEASTTLALAPTHSNCDAFGIVGVEVNPEGCAYLFHVAEQSAEDNYKSTFEVSCEAGKSIKVSAGTCKMEIKAQSGLASVALANDTEAAPKRDLTFDPEVANLAYTVTQDGFFCPFGGTGAKTGGTFTGSATTLTGQSPSSPETKIGVEVG